MQGEAARLACGKPTAFPRGSSGDGLRRLCATPTRSAEAATTRLLAPPPSPQQQRRPNPSEGCHSDETARLVERKTSGTLGPGVISDEGSECSWAWHGRLPENLKLGEELGRGTFGVVREAKCEETGRDYAVKVLNKKRPGYSSLLLRARIDNEVSVWMELQDCEDVVILHRCYEDDSHVYLVQERCSGGSLADVLKERERVAEIEAAALVASILRMLTNCHEKCICYGDIKPANFLLPYSGRGARAPRQAAELKAVDFGSAQRTECGKAKLMAENGTPLYMAPEVQAPPYGLESDVWSVGILLYQLLSGTPPFVSSVAKTMKELTPASLAYAVAYVKLNFDGEAWKDTSSDAKDLISRMLERDVSRRISARDALNHRWMVNCLGKQRSDPCDFDLSKVSGSNVVETALVSSVE